MAVPTRLIRRRIKSVANTKKITKALELVSAAKMRRAVASATAARRFAKLGAALLARLSSLGATMEHPYFCGTDDRKTLAIVISSDRGMCGAYNAQVLRTIELEAKRRTGTTEYIAVGKYALQYLERSNRPVIASFPSLSNEVRAHDVRAIMSLATSEFAAGVYGEVVVITTHFQSALKQVPTATRLLPLKPPQEESQNELPSDIAMEPTPAEVLEYTLPRFLESTLYQAVLEAAASEHSARMMSMRSASDAASDMIDDLTFTLNQARQSAITSEIAEISAGRAALEG